FTRTPILKILVVPYKTDDDAIRLNNRCGNLWGGQAASSSASSEENGIWGMGGVMGDGAAADGDGAAAGGGQNGSPGWGWGWTACRWDETKLSWKSNDPKAAQNLDVLFSLIKTCRSSSKQRNTEVSKGAAKHVQRCRNE
ncbi:hypothetical protein L7F22_035485, partial [Adiantum nelumboides]|nr:hypothetical protein [Adiantum nelumboides]